jgi:hypothetical protein
LVGSFFTVSGNEVVIGLILRCIAAIATENRHIDSGIARVGGQSFKCACGLCPEKSRVGIPDDSWDNHVASFIVQGIQWAMLVDHHSE